MAQLKLLVIVALPHLSAGSSRKSTGATPPPFSFTLGSAPFHSSLIPDSWTATAATFTQPPGDRTDFTWTDNATGIQAAVQQTAYTAADAAGAFEWLLTFRNTGASPSPPLCNVSALDTVLPKAVLGTDPTVHRFTGSAASPVDYLPIIYSVPHASTPPGPAPSPGPVPHPNGTLIHSNTSANEMADGIRLWCGGKPGDNCGYGMPHSTFSCPTASACQAACAGNKTCLGATWVHPGTLGPTPKCYMLGSLDSYDPEVGFSSWSKITVPAKPPPHPTPTPSTGPRFHPNGGRSSNGALPYFAVFGQKAGLVYSIGWSGGWEAEVAFADDPNEPGHNAGGVHVEVSHTTGPGTLCASLRPGEAIRSMRIIAVPFNRNEAQQKSVLTDPTLASAGYMFRRNGSVAQPIAHSFPSTLADALAEKNAPPDATPGGYNGLGFGQDTHSPGTYPQVGFNKHRRIMSRWKLPRDAHTGAVSGAMVASWAWIGWPKPQTLEQQLWHVSAVKNTTVEYYWLDAGWFNGDFPNGVGNWQLPLSACVNRAEYPNGSLAPLGTACHAAPNDVGFIVWFEPERVAAGTYIDKHFPEYLLKHPGSSLLNLGDDQARAYIQRYLSAAVDEYGLDVLRMDYNIDPGPIWHANDEDGRSGMVEAAYIEGLYTMWDAILSAHPGLLIDDCSSGGRRIDIETLARSFPLWRSDNGGSAKAPGAVTLQIQSMGLTQLAPISSGAVWDVDPYNWRSAGVFGKTISWGLAGWQRILGNDTLVAELKQAVAETKSLRRYAFGDYYPLTNTTSSLSDWAAYQFHLPTGGSSLAVEDKDESIDPAAGSGFAVYFRRPGATASTMPAGLLALDTRSKYDVTLFHGYTASGSPVTKTGAELTQWDVALEPNACVLLRYEKAA